MENKENHKKIVQKKNIKTKKRTIIVLIMMMFALLFGYILFRGSYIEVKEIGENYLEAFRKNVIYTVITFIINFSLLYITFYFTNVTIKKGLKIFFDDEKKEMPKFPNKSVSFIIALIGSLTTTKLLLNNILLFFSNSKFGINDLVFGLDISYFMFQKPLINFVLIYLLVIVITSLVYAVVYSIIVLNISFDGVERESIKKCDLIGKLRFRIKLIAIILGLIVFFNMVHNIGNEQFLSIELPDGMPYYLFGAGLVDVTVKLWGYIILAILTTFSIIKAYKSIKEKSLRRVLGYVLVVPVYLISLAGVLAGYQLIFIGSNELESNQKYIEENIKQTKIAYGINLEEINLDYSGTITENEIEENKNVINNIVIVNKSTVLQDLQSSQTLKGYYTFRNTQIAQYNINDKPTLVYVTPREISNNNTTYSNKTYEYTHGFGSVITKAGQVDETGNLLNIQKEFGDLSKSSIPITEPRIYFGLETNDAIVINNENISEFDYINSETNKEEVYNYTGNAGLNLNFWDRFVLAIKEGDMKLAFSGSVTSNSRIITNRNILERAKIIMPYLTYDENPYLVIDDKGSQYWVIDAYTTSNCYPFSQPITLSYNKKINYIRNSVKVIVNAFDGTMKFYITDRTDPIVMAYNNMYPDLFEKKEEVIPEDISKHFIYPQYLYNIQSEVIQKYHNIQTEVFYRGNDMWQIAKTNGNSKNSEQIQSYYTMVQTIDNKNEQLGLVLPYTPYGKQNMLAYLVGTYENGIPKLKIYEFPTDSNVLGPMQIETQINQDENISKDIASLSVSGTKITKNLIAVPINNTIIYVQSIYQQLLNETTEQKPTLKRVIVVSGNKIAIGDNTEEAILNLLSKSAGSIDITNKEDMQDLINAIIKANENVKNSSSNSDWKLFGEDMQTLTNLIEKLKIINEQNSREIISNNLVNTIEEN